MKTSYDKSTDSLYIELRALPSCRTVQVAADVMVDYTSDGEPVGYDIQHASTKADFIARVILEDMPQLQPMTDEYDFSKGERGKFFHAEMTLTPPNRLGTDHEVPGTQI